MSRVQDILNKVQNAGGTTTTGTNAASRQPTAGGRVADILSKYAGTTQKQPTAEQKTEPVIAPSAVPGGTPTVTEQPKKPTAPSVPARTSGNVLDELNAVKAEADRRIGTDFDSALSSAYDALVAKQDAGEDFAEELKAYQTAYDDYYGYFNEENLDRLLKEAEKQKDAKANDPAWKQAVIDLERNLYAENASQYKDAVDKHQKELDEIKAWEKTLRQDKQSAKYIQYMSMAGKDDFEKYSKQKTWLNDYVKELDGHHGDAAAQLSEDELAVYNYLYNKEGRKKADEYYEFLKGFALTERQGVAKAKHIQGLGGFEKTVAGLGTNAWAGVQDWWGGTKSWFTGDAEQSAGQIAAQILTEEAGPVASVAYQGARVVGNMAPSILLSKGTGAVAGKMGASAATAAKVGKTAGRLSMFHSIAGNSYAQKIQEGWEEKDARLFGTLMGASEIATEAIFNGIPGLGGAIDADDFVRTLNGSLSRIVTGGVINAVGEIAEEELQMLIEPAIEQYFVGGDYKAPTGKEALDVALVTTIATAAMNAPHSIGLEINYNKYGKMVQQQHGWKELADRAQKLGAGTTSAKIAEKISAEPYNVSYSDIGRLYMQMHQDGILKNGKSVEKPAPTTPTDTTPTAQTEQAEGTPTAEQTAQPTDTTAPEAAAERLQTQEATVMPTQENAPQAAQEAAPDVMTQEAQRLFAPATGTTATPDVMTQEAQRYGVTQKAGDTITPEAPAAEERAEKSVGSAAGWFDPWSRAQIEYGTMNGNENAVRDDSAPVSTDGRNRVSKVVTNVLGAEMTPEAAVDPIRDLTMQGETASGLAYIPEENSATMSAVRRHVETVRWDVAKQEFFTETDKGKVDSRIVAQGILLYNNAVNSGNVKEALDILSTLAEIVRRGAQATQFMTMLRKLSPEHRLYVIQRSILKMNQKNNSAKGEKELAQLQKDIDDNKVQKKQTGEQKNRNGSNVPVERWMELVGKSLAKHIKNSTKGKLGRNPKTVSQTILSDLKKFYSTDTANGGTELGSNRSEFDRMLDLFTNREQYQKAWDSARETLKDDPAALAAFDSWIENLPTTEERLAKFLTGSDDITLSTDVTRRFLEAKTDEERNATIKEMQQEVARQLSATTADKWRAWRMVSMLGTFKGPIRNITSNVLTGTMYRAKNALRAGIEKLFRGKFGRTSSAFISKELMDAGRRDFAANKDTIVDGSRHGEAFSTDSFLRGAQEQMQIFQNPVLEGYRKATNWALNNEFFGDEAFMRNAYARYLGGYLKANGITAENWNSNQWQERNGETAAAARAFAKQQAQEATLRDRNELSDIAVKTGRGANKGIAAKILSVIGEAPMPFRRTPTNALVRIEQFSPLGIANAVANAVMARNGQTNSRGETVTSQDVLESICKALTGSGVMLLGGMLARAGILRGSEDEDKKQAQFDELTGQQESAIYLPDGTNITIDWAAPATAPLLIGAELEKIRQEGGWSWNEFFDTLLSISDPLLETSMLSGLNKAIDDVKYSDHPIPDLAIALTMDFFGQGASTLAGQVSRSFREDSTMTYVDKESPLPSIVQKGLGEVSRKLPGPGYNQVPYIDAWGRTENIGETLAGRFVNNVFNPAFVDKAEKDDTETELQRLYDSEIDKDGLRILPTRAAKYFTMDGETVNLTADQYVEYATAKGQLSKQYIEEAMATPEYQAMDDQNKANYVSKMYDLANYHAKKKLFPDYESDNFKSYDTWEARGLTPAKSYLLIADWQ